MSSVGAMGRINGYFNTVTKEADRKGLPYIAYLYHMGYAIRFLSKRGAKGKTISTTSKTQLAQIEADIKRLWRSHRLERVIRSDGTNKSESLH